VDAAIEEAPDDGLRETYETRLFHGFIEGATVMTPVCVVVLCGWIYAYNRISDREVVALGFVCLLGALFGVAIASIVFSIGLVIVRHTLGMRRGVSRWTARAAGALYVAGGFVAPVILPRLDVPPETAQATFLGFVFVAPLLLPVFVVWVERPFARWGSGA
jgi:hypothetical protein